MFTPRRTAQMGLGIACLILVSSTFVLISGGSEVDSKQADSKTAEVSDSNTTAQQAHVQVPLGMMNNVTLANR